MKINKNWIAVILTLTTIFAIISTTMIYNAMIIDDSDNEEEESTLILLPPEPELPEPENISIPEDYFINIENIIELKGYNNTWNLTENLEALKYIDNKTYNILGNYSIPSNSYEFEFYFEFPLNFELIPKNYDIFLYLDYSANNSEIVYFQGYNNIDWFNITEISNTNKSLNAKSVEEVLKFRIIGNISNQKRIEINRLCFIYQHNGILTKPTLSNSKILYHNQYGGDYYIAVGSLGSTFTQTNYAFTHNNWFGIRICVESNLTYPFNPDFQTEYYLYSSVSFSSSGSKYLYLRIWDYDLSSWKLINPSYNSPYFLLYLNSSVVNQDNQVKYEIECKTRGRVGSFFKMATIKHYSKYPYIIYDYPEISTIFIDPEEPIDTISPFKIKANPKPSNSEIHNSSYFIENKSTSWNEMTYSLGNWASDSINPLDFDKNGKYRVWINITDENGLSTINYTDFYIQIPPSDFTLESDAEEPIDTDASFILNWSKSAFAENYTIYTSENYITEIDDSLTLVGKGLTNFSYELNNIKNGTNYYIIVAFNEFGNITSNCIKAIVDKYPHSFTLTTDAGDPIEFDGFFNLTWTESLLADNYSVYQSNEYFFNPLNAILIIEGIEELNYSINGVLIGFIDNLYYYRIVSFNQFGNITSNCIEIDIQVLPKQFILQTTKPSLKINEIFTLSWNESINANNYSIFVYTTNISESFLVIGDLLNQSYTFSISLVGTYYFFMIAENEFGLKISNILKITVIISSTPTPLVDGDDDDKAKDEPANLTWLWITIGCVGGGVGVGIVLYYLNKKKSLFKFR